MPEGDEPKESSSRPEDIRSIGNRTHQTGLLLLWLVLAETKEPTENEKWAAQINLEYMSPGTPVRDKPRHKCSGLSQLESLKGEWVRGSCHSLAFFEYVPLSSAVCRLLPCKQNPSMLAGHSHALMHIALMQALCSV